MMLPSTKEEIELRKKLVKATTVEEKVEILEKIAEISKKKYEELADCPFAH